MKYRAMAAAWSSTFLLPEFVRALKHPRDGVASRNIQRDLALARLVLAVPDVEHALTRGAFDVPHPV
jgi:hypothetical protein